MFTLSNDPCALHKCVLLYLLESSTVENVGQRATPLCVTVLLLQWYTMILLGKPSACVSWEWHDDKISISYHMRNDKRYLWQ